MERREPLDRSVFPDLGLTPVSQRQPPPPTRGVLVYRGLIIAFGVLAAVGLWDHPAAVLFAWLFALFGLGFVTIPARILGTVTAIILLGVLTGIWPERSVYFLETPEETARKVLQFRAMIAGSLAAAAIGWVALAVGRWYREREARHDRRVTPDP